MCGGCLLRHTATLKTNGLPPRGNLWIVRARGILRSRPQDPFRPRAVQLAGQGLAFESAQWDVDRAVGYFWRDWWRMGRAGLRDLGSHRFTFREHSNDSRLLWLIALGSVPAAVTGLLFNDWIEENLRQPWLVAIALALVGAIMWVADRRSKRERTIEGVRSWTR